MRYFKEPINKIYCIGDSHSRMFCKENIPKNFPNLEKYFCIFNIGPSLAYNLLKLQTTTGGREKLFKCLDEIPQKSTVMLFFGEIDCRYHLINQSIKQKKNIDFIIKECVNRYFLVISEIINLGFEVVVFNVIPSIIIKYKRPILLLGSNRERNEISIKFNRYLNKKCNKKNKCTFIPVFAEIISKNLKTKNKYYRDGIHFGKKAYPIVISKMNKLIKSFNYP